ncbi:MAG: 2-C-methyl-D-erythritol 2,4-cyclodiphosphate synthase [Flavobacteriales bacterium]|nr:2-C-methyl-D-erythritol 2,4-cyclodiphosphate synthase [Flavobacteriales bacterium]
METNHPFWLGGIRIDHEKGAVGHSDADTLIHAICDALLGAAALGDIGKHFPDTSDQYKGIDSKILLEHVVRLLANEGYRVVNVDATVALQRPKIAPYLDEMRQVLAGILGIDTGCVSVKATTTEKLGFEGREEGVSVQAIALIAG